MMAPGHIMVALASYQVAVTVFGASNEPWLYGMAIIGGLVPDIDEPKSTINNSLQFLSKPIGRLFKHRGFTHSFIAMVLFFWMFATLWNDTPAWLIALWIGYVSHLIADFHTISGIPFLWPLKKINFRNPFFHFRTGSNMEWFATFACACLVAYIWVYA